MASRMQLFGGVLLVFAPLTVLAEDTSSVRLEGQPNFRDLGGYRTTDGRTGRRYR